jgi:hypothetical protein
MHKPLVMEVGVDMARAMRKQKRWVILRPVVLLSPAGAAG